ncbi:MAG TPA: ribonuclease HIII [Methylomusa anaerophila]|uniref:Ribonuclease n=1 Tax=Methylomusa anaerophila TaxID=1930071 RepID=A0A348AQF6_9FIRM|nr:ribonuclease HIII [Methylomusa anaerophila]BBB93304.1 ribonuclease HIII [Methylomusa anaerophila]HML86865.1 ribonuclease HIII [Methylomusa anaerophila]
MDNDKIRKRIDSLTLDFRQLNLQVVGEKIINYGIQIQISDGTTTIPVNIYSGKKGITVTVGGAENLLKQKISAVIKGEQVELFNTPADSSLNRPYGFEHLPDFDGKWIGIDESGKGDFFGPLVAAAVLVDQATAERLALLGVKDCKTLTDEKSKAFANRIREECANRYIELELIPVQYNNLYSQCKNEGKNLNHLLAWAHAQVLENLLEKETCNYALADQFANPHYTEGQLLTRGKQITLIQTHRAERNIAVAAASVLARDRFLNRMKDLSEKYNLSFPKGATNVLDAARLFVKKYGKDALTEVCKTHFRTYEQI